MLDESQFRGVAEAALNSLMQHLIVREEEDGAGFEVDEQNGVLKISFEEPMGTFVITPNAPVRQIWISALSTSFKLEWDEAASAFILPRTGEPLMALTDRLIEEHLDR
jgi:CyaY protein